MAKTFRLLPSGTIRADVRRSDRRTTGSAQAVTLYLQADQGIVDPLTGQRLPRVIEVRLPLKTYERFVDYLHTEGQKARERYARVAREKRVQDNITA